MSSNAKAPPEPSATTATAPATTAATAAADASSSSNAPPAPAPRPTARRVASEEETSDDDTLAAYSVARSSMTSGTGEASPGAPIGEEPRSPDQRAKVPHEDGAAVEPSEEESRQAAAQEYMRRSVSKSDELLARKEILSTQTQCHSKCKEEDDIIWRRQSGAYKAVYKRLLVSKKTASDLHIYLNDRVRRLRALFELTDSDIAFGADETGTLSQATSSLELLTKNGQQQFTEAYEGVFKDAISKASDFEKESLASANSLREKAEKLSEQVSSFRVLKETSWMNYESCVKETLLLEAEGRITPKNKDPYLLARKYLQDLSKYRTVQVTYCTEMHKVIEEFKLQDGRRISALKEILLDHLIAEKTIITNKLKLIDDSLGAVKRIDREVDVSEFMNSCPFLATDANGRNAFDMQPGTDGDVLIVERLRSHVVWKGALSRPGKIIKSNWKLGHAVISLAGFLHWFDHRSDEAPSIRMQLKGASVKRDSEDATAFSLFVPNNSFFSLSSSQSVYPFKAECTQDLIEWVAALETAIERASS